MEASPQFSHLGILKAIRRREPVSRIELGPLTGLSNATVSGIVNDLLQRGFVTEHAGEQRLRGRPRTYLRLNPGGALIGGLFVHPDRIVDIQIANLLGERIGGGSRQLASGLFSDAFVEEAGQAFEDICRESGRMRDLLAVGVSVPTIVDTDAELVHWIAPTRPSPTPFRALLERRLGKPVYVDTMANIVARSEHWSGDGSGSDDMTVILVGAGLGMTQYAGQAIRYGAHGFNTEFGHVKVAAAAGRPCPCGGTGCLVTVASHYGILREAMGMEQMLDPTVASLHQRFEDVVDRANAGNPHLRAIVTAAGRALGTAIANHVNVFDPPKIVVIFQTMQSMALMEEGVREQLDADTLWTLRGRAELLFRNDDRTHNVDGAIALALDRLFGAS